MATNPTSGNSGIGGATSNSAPQYQDYQFDLDVRRNDYVRRVEGKRTVAGLTDLILGAYAGGEWVSRHRKAVFSSVLPDGYYAAKELGGSEKYYEVKNGKARQVEWGELVNALPTIPLKVKMRILPDAVEYSFEYNFGLKEYLKMQGAKWDPEKKVWRASTMLKLPEGDLELEEAD